MSVIHVARFSVELSLDRLFVVVGGLCVCL